MGIEIAALTSFFGLTGAFALVGAGGEETRHQVPCHSARYDFNDALIAPMARVYARLAGAPLPAIPRRKLRLQMRASQSFFPQLLCQLLDSPRHVHLGGFEDAERAAVASLLAAVAAPSPKTPLQ